MVYIIMPADQNHSDNGLNAKARASTVVTLAVIFGESFDQGLLRGFSRLLSAPFPYHEILVIANPPRDDRLDLERLLAETPNLRCLAMAQRLPDDALRRVALEQAIGDYLIVFTHGVDDPAMVETLLGKLADDSLAVPDYIGFRYKSRWLSFGAILELAFSKIIRLTAGLTIEPGLSHCACYSRALINAVNAQNNLATPLKLQGAVLECRRMVIDHEGARGRPLRHLFGRVMTGLEIIGTASPRLLRLAALLCFTCSFGNVAYIAFVLLVGLFQETIQAGWISTNIELGVMNAVLFFTLGIFAIVGADSIVRQQGRGKDQVAREISKTDFVKQFTDVNVETE